MQTDELGSVERFLWLLGFGSGTAVGDLNCLLSGSWILDLEGD
jgi:hypothetical protein